MASSLVAEAERPFERGESEALLDFATEHWPANLSAVSAYHAELARYARVAAYDAGEAFFHLWQARALAAAGLTGNFRSLSLSLQPEFFALTETQRCPEARQALEVIEQVAAADDGAGPPDRRLIARIITERRAFSYRLEENWREAELWYRKAFELTSPGSRGRAKVRGGIVLVSWLAGGDNATAAAEFGAIVESASDWRDVREAAAKNRAAAERDDRNGHVPFDLV